jgi:hypothetical protein
MNQITLRNPAKAQAAEKTPVTNAVIKVKVIWTQSRLMKDATRPKEVNRKKMLARKIKLVVRGSVFQYSADRFHYEG